MKKTKKIITLISVLLILMIFLPEFVEAKDISSRSELTSGPNVGNRVYLGNGRDDGTISMFKESDHLYCVQHRADTEDAWYRVDAYVEINGTKATAYTGQNGQIVKTANSSVNTVLAYVCGEQNYYKGYNNSYTNDGVRMRAIHKYLQTWYNNVGFSKLGINRKWNDSGFSLDNHKPVKQRALNLISDGQNYANKTNSNTPRIDKSSTTKEIEQISNTTYGPFKIKYDGIIESVVVRDNSGNVINNVEFSTDAKGNDKVNATNLKSNNNYYIQNKSGRTIKNVSIKLKDSEVLSAKIWFIERNDGARSQRLITVDTGKTKAQGETYVMNIIPIVSVKGYVWVDVQRTKANDTNSLADDDEARVAGVTVNLVNKSTKKVIATAKTDSNGSYTFEKIMTASKLKNYYVEFDYRNVKVSNQDISKYIPVAFNSTNINEINKKGSRALMDSVAKEDSKLSGIARTYTGTEKAKETIYGIGYKSNLYNKLLEGEVLNNINLGLKKIPETEYVISENLANVKIGIKGYEYTYIYGGNGDRSRVAAPKVNWQNSQDIYAYSRDIYPSDIVYKDEDATKELTVDVTYRIDITNTTNYNIEELYKEQKLYITNLANKFDTKRYELNDKNWTANNDTATITDDYRKNIYGNGINSNGTATSYITFKVKRDALVDILNHPDGIIENNPTQATAVGYHQYTRKDYSWQNNITKDQTHVTPNDIRSADAPYLIFKLGEERVLSGRVFEDTVITTDGQKLGNGVYNETENVVGDVKVELLDIGFDQNTKKEITDITQLNVSSIYPRDRINSDKLKNNEQISIKAEVKTGKDGVFTLNGLVPGYYYLRFTYGDGTQKIYDLSGNEISTLSVKDYKSTIITNDIAKQALKGGTNFEWYKQLNNANASVAIDNLNTRIAVNAGTPNSNIMAGTAKIHITIENTPEIDKTNIEITENGQSSLVANKFNGLNLGLIKMPIQKAKFEKIITNIKLVNAQANFGFGGNPETDAMQGVSDLDQTKNGGSKYVRAELADEYISGANLELTYGIKVTNISDVNYYNNDYYWYGEADSNKEVTLNVQELTDYLDQTLQFKPDVSDSRLVVGTDENITNKTILKVQNIGILYTENNKARETDKLKTSDTVPVIAERILSKQDDDMEFINEAKITNISNGTDTRDNAPEKETQIKVIKAIEDNYESKATATVTPPTGANRQEIILYTIAGVIALAVLSAGVVMIKKIVKK